MNRKQNNLAYEVYNSTSTVQSIVVLRIFITETGQHSLRQRAVHDRSAATRLVAVTVQQTTRLQRRQKLKKKVMTQTAQPQVQA
jgi:hypothetical protein